ncbi:hypothetical protein MAAFP003_1243 [Mycobacterium ahvazicum]|uniref:DUF4435 domain-containing protein n=1 Tax=Mycobacterium ahvazicum TaxID=1964395 RepID=A0A2K4Y750_9MYCO|nr:hypothetical protein [Mycobacterium ahvazicum]SOX52577.1 hypothetical protein MAAFP003_1243 [Mycobacterium ahvazicum]
MRQYLSGDTLYNNIRMLLAARTTPILVVEGESDHTLFEEKLGTSIPFFLITSYGKSESIRAAEKSSEDQVDRVLFLIDADFDRLTGAITSYPPNHIVATVHYDLMCDIVMSTARPVLSVIRAFSHPDKAKLDPGSILEIAFEAAAMVGSFRYAAHVKCWQVNLARFPMHLVIPDHNSAVEHARVAHHVGERAKSAPAPLPSDFQNIALECSGDVSSEFLINSHDLLDAILHCCRKYGNGKVSTKIEPTLILAIDSTEFTKLTCVKATIDWASQFEAA